VFRHCVYIVDLRASGGKPPRVIPSQPLCFFT
jgi:hypothetical protein